MSTFMISICRPCFGGYERDCVWIEIPIERKQELGDTTIRSEILITFTRELKNIIQGMPHVEKLLLP